ncbi:DUF2283 domain-containing protein [Salinisphaera sp.]|uniref:DUF2283 domain-containing protein n=1 Tax=Salinisphaera sp. TaxID=1914330 RepID=UPI003C797C07
MKIQYCDDTDTIYIEFRADNIAETRGLDESTILEVDAEGNVCAITFEHASEQTDVEQLQVQGMVV